MFSAVLFCAVFLFAQPMLETTVDSIIGAPIDLDNIQVGVGTGGIEGNVAETRIAETAETPANPTPPSLTPAESSKASEPVKTETTTDIPVKKAEEPELSPAVIEELSNQKLLLGKVESATDLFQYLRNNLLKRNYRAAAMAMAFEKSNYVTQAMRQDCLAKWSDIIDRVEPIHHRQFLPYSDKTDHLVFRTANSHISLEFAKDANDFWQISAKTLADTDKIYDLVRNDPPISGDPLSRIVPQWMHKVVLGLSYYRWAALFGGLIAGFVVYWVVQRILYHLTRAYMHVVYKDVKQESRKVWKQLGLIAMAGVWFLFFSRNVASPRAYEVAFFFFVVFVTFMVFLIALKIIDILTEALRVRILAKNQYSPENVESLLVPFFSRTMKTIVFCAAIGYVAKIFGWPLAAVISGMGIGGIAIAFAAKETVANLFGSITVMMDKPFEIGDWIETNGVAGTVVSVGMRSTRIQTSDFGSVTIPNNNLTTAVINNLGRRRNRRFKTFLTLQYDTPIDRIEMFCEALKELVLKNAFTQKEGFFIGLNNLGASSIDILFNVVLVCPSLETENRERAKILKSILKLAEAMDVRFAYPSQTLYLDKDSPRAYHPLEAKGSPAEIGRQYVDKLFFPPSPQNQTTPTEKPETQKQEDQASQRRSETMKTESPKEPL